MEFHPVGVTLRNCVVCTVFGGPEHFIRTPPSLHVEGAVLKVCAVVAVPGAVDDVGAGLGYPFLFEQKWGGRWGDEGE